MIEQSLLEKLVEALRCMPGVGRKSAQRIAHYLLQRDRDGAKYLSELMADAMERIGNCKSCRNFTENEFCHICMDKKRDDTVLFVLLKIHQTLMQLKRQISGAFILFYWDICRH